MSPVTFDDPPAPPQRATEPTPTFIPDPKPATPEQKTPQLTAGEPTGFIADPTENALGTVDPPPEDSVFEKVWHKLNHPIFGKKAIETGLGIKPRQLEAQKKETEKYIASGQSSKAFWSQFWTGTEESTRDLVQGLATPVSIGLAALSLGESIWGEGLWTAGTAGKAAVVAARGAQIGAGAVFGGQGALQAITSRQEGESDADYAERVLSGSAQAALAASGELAANKDIIRGFIRNRLHLSDNVADMVIGRLSKIAAARERQATETKRIEEEAAAKRREIDTEKAQAVVKVETQLEENIRSLEGQTNARLNNLHQSAQEEIAGLKEHVGNLDQEKVKTGTQVIVDTAQTLYTEKLRVQKPFKELGDTFEQPVSTKTDIRNLMMNTLKEHGAQDSELPPAATKALGKGTKGESFIDTGEGLEPLEDAGEKVTFNDLTRIKDDAYGAAYSSKDPVVRNSMIDVADKIDKMQEAAVANKDRTSYPRREKESMGEYRKRLIRDHPQSATAKYEAAKNDYMRFKRGIGSEIVDKWLSAYDIEDQEMSAKVSALILKEDPQFGLDKSSSPTLAIRNALKAVGVDTTAFDETVKNIRKARVRAKQVPGEVTVGERGAKKAAGETAKRENKVAGREIGEAQRTATEAKRSVTTEEKARTAEVVKDTEKDVVEQEAKGAIIPGKTTSELAGKSNEELLREQLNAMSKDAKISGVAHPYRLAIVIYGMFKMAVHPTAGIAMVAYGAGPEAFQSLLRQPDFQDWVIRQSGVEPGNKRAVGALKRGLTGGVYPLLRRMVVGQAPAAALENKNAGIGETGEKVSFGALTMGAPPAPPDR
jgi:hypothetical protein